MGKTSLILGICSIAMLTACRKDLKPTSADEFSSSSRSENPVAQAASDPYVSNEILVKFKKNVPENGRVNALARIGGKVKEKVLTKMMERIGDEGFYVVHTPIAVLEAVGKMKGLEDIEYAEPNFVYTHGATSNDTYYSNGSLWGMYGDASSPANQYGSQAAEAWAANHTGSNDIYIGIIDEGAMWNHEDFLSSGFNSFGRASEPSGGGDNDGNGLDDPYGWDFVNNDNSVFDGLDDDHGTHVAGTIGAIGGNAKGVAGVCWNVKMISAKFLGKNGGTTANAIKAVDYITDLKVNRGLNIIATNNSWGGGGFSQALQDAITRAGNADILFIAAAGNSGYNIETTKSYPASYTNDNIIAVAAIASNGTIPSWTNYGSTSVDLGAPGSGINSTLPKRTGNKVGSGYGSYSGTSMATPHVSGGAALYASTHPGADAATIKAAILNSAVPTPSLAGKTVTGDRLNVSGF